MNRECEECNMSEEDGIEFYTEHDICTKCNDELNPMESQVQDYEMAIW